MPREATRAASRVGLRLEVAYGQWFPWGSVRSLHRTIKQKASSQVALRLEVAHEGLQGGLEEACAERVNAPNRPFARSSPFLLGEHAGTQIPGKSFRNHARRWKKENENK